MLTRRTRGFYLTPGNQRPQGSLRKRTQGAHICPSVLILAGIELIFFLVADTVLWFGFSVRILLITC